MRRRAETLGVRHDLGRELKWTLQPSVATFANEDRLTQYNPVLSEVFLAR
jgi:hypothetical protein